MKTVPGFLQGPCRQAMHVALDDVRWTGPTMCARREDRSCGCCPECCSIDLHGEGSLQRTNCRNGSRILSMENGRI